VLYYLIKPIARAKLGLFNVRFLAVYLTSLAVLYMATSLVSQISFPDSPNFSFFYVYAVFSFGAIVYFCITIFSISKEYAKIGFVRKPFLFGGIGGTTYALAFVLMVYSCFKFAEPADLSVLYYLISFYFASSVFSFIYHIKFIVDYPSLLEPKWKVLMPFDLSKVTTIATMLFLSVSIYLTSKVHPNFVIYETIPYYLLPILLLPIALVVMFILNCMRQLVARTKLIYWEILKYGLFVHVAVTFYIFSLITLLWNTTTTGTRILGMLFGVVSFFFYLFFAFDLRTILEEQKIRPIFNNIDIAHTIIAFYSCLFIILFGVSFIYKGDSTFVIGEILPNPVLLFFVAFFLIAFGTYLSVTHKGFEEIMKKNVWSELSYIFAFIVFLFVYLIYSASGSQLQRFQYHNMAFAGYFIVLIIEILSSWTLEEKSKLRKKRKADIVDLLNYDAQSFLRTDYLEDLWKKTVERCVNEREQTKISFDPARRAFDLSDLDETIGVTVAVRMLLQMHELAEVEKITMHRKSLAETKEEIMKILREKILRLPEDLRAEFDEDLCYPLLLEKSINDLLTHLSTFIPAKEHREILEGLKRRDELFGCIDFETEEIRVREGTRFGRDKFLELFKRYLEAVGDKFPFKRCLLRGLVKEEIRTDAHAPIAASEVFDIISTGIKELNLVMMGGLVKGSITLLITEETKAKQKMLHALMTRNLPEGMSILYATSKRPYQQIQGELLMELDSVDRVTMLDLYAPLYEEKGVSELVEYDHRIIVPLSKILFQRSFVKVIKSQPKNQPRLVIIDVYDDFAKYYQPAEIYELLQTQVEGLKRWDCTTVLILDPHSHLLKKVGVDEVKKNFENILVLTGAEKETVVQIEKLFHGTPGKRVVHLEW
jgi:KaiC/GvpD/RAD55 family RecA-like ATPase